MTVRRGMDRWMDGWMKKARGVNEYEIGVLT